MNLKVKKMILTDQNWPNNAQTDKKCATLNNQTTSEKKKERKSKIIKRWKRKF